jgi:hypothetical protein
LQHLQPQEQFGLQSLHVHCEQQHLVLLLQHALLSLVEAALAIKPSAATIQMMANVFIILGSNN